MIPSEKISALIELYNQAPTWDMWQFILSQKSLTSEERAELAYHLDKDSYFAVKFLDASSKQASVTTPAKDAQHAVELVMFFEPQADILEVHHITKDEHWFFTKQVI